MPYWLLLLLALGGLLLGAPTALLGQSAQHARGPILRAISLQPSDSIRLGQRFPKGIPYRQVNDSVLELLPGTFAGARAIGVRVSRAGTVHTLEFTYAAGTSLDTLATAYEDALGFADVSVSMEGGMQSRWWQDDSTWFELIERHGPRGRQLTAVLCDRRLGASCGLTR
jgi:hypothetical protein